jgi:hypothetical protein
MFQRTHRSYARDRCEKKGKGMVSTDEVENQKKGQRSEMIGGELEDEKS